MAGFLDFLKVFGPQAQAQMPAAAPVADKPTMFGGLSRFNERHPGLLMGVGSVLADDDMTPAMTYAMGVKKERKAEAEKTANQNKTKAWLLSQGHSEAEIDAAIAAGQVGGYFKKDGKASWINAGDGNLYNPDDGEWIRPPGADGMQPVDEDAFKRERETRKDYDDEDVVKSYKKVRDSYERVRAAATTNSGPGDIGLIFNYMKMLDPGSVVREGEFALASNAGGVDETVRSMYNSLINGERLTPELRQQFVAAADQLYAESAGNLGNVNERYSDIASDWQIDPSRVVVAPEKYEPLKLGQTKKLPSGVTIKKIGD
jgi:hypothetical protein